MFLYVFTREDADALLGRGLALINHDYYNGIYIFEKPPDDFYIDCPHVFSDTMSFQL